MSGGFNDLGLLPELIRAVDDLGWSLPTDIQDEAIPLILGGGDVMGAAETGSGKTAAFTLPVLQCVYERLKSVRDKTNAIAETVAINDSPSSVETSPHKRKHKDRSSAVSGPDKVSANPHSTEPIRIRLNPHDSDAELSINPMGCTCSDSPVATAKLASTSDSTSWKGARATHGVRRGFFYYEVSVEGKGNCRVGWSTLGAHLDLGTDSQGFGFGAKGFKSFSGQFETYGKTFTQGDVIGCYLNTIKREITFAKNGELFPCAFVLPADLADSVLFPTVSLSNSQASFNFGQSPFVYSSTLPLGCVSVACAQPGVQLFDSNSEVSFYRAGAPLALIIEPTRDLAEQVQQCITDLSRYIDDPPLRSILLIGDSNQSQQQIKQRLQSGVDIVVGTIGKLVALTQSGQLDLSHIRFLILDEADKLSSADNIDDVKLIFKKCPISGSGLHRLQVCFFSATLHSQPIRDLAAAVCQNPTWIDLKGQETVLPHTLHHVVLPVLPKKHFAQLSSGSLTSSGANVIVDEVHLPNELKGGDVQALHSQQIKLMKPQLALQLIDRFDMSQVLIFCRTNLDCANLETFFNNQNSLPENKKKGLEEKYSCRMLGGLLSMEDRRRNLQMFKEGEIRILICTDVAARGIDINGLPFVINMTLPDQSEDYVHRIGRVGRSDRLGLAISLVAMEDKEKVWYHQCNRRGGVGCSNRNLIDKQGCTTWYSEPLLLQKIEEKISTPIERMVSSVNSSTGRMEWTLPSSIAQLNCQYGEVANDSLLHGTESKTYMNDYMVEEVKQLAALEIKAQNIFWRMQDVLSSLS